MFESIRTAFTRFFGPQSLSQDVLALPRTGSGVRRGQSNRRLSRATCAAIESLESRTLLATIVVNSLVDDIGNLGIISLRDAVEIANNTPGEDTITFDPSLTANGATEFTLSRGEMTLTDANYKTTITGPGANLMFINGGAGSGDLFTGLTGNVSRIFRIKPGVTVEIRDLTMMKGQSPGGSGGGAIINQGTLTVVGSTFSANTAGGGNGGAIFNASGLEGDSITVCDGTLPCGTVLEGTSIKGTLTVVGSTFSGNTAGGGDGGAIHTEGPLTVTDSIFSGNSARDGGGIYILGNDDRIIRATITGVTFLQNSAANRPGGGSGGGIRNNGGALNVAGSGFIGNIADFGGGGLATSGLIFSAIHDSNFVGNHAGRGGGILNEGDTVVYQTSLSNNTATGGGGIFNQGVLKVTGSTLSRNAVTYDGVINFQLNSNGGMGAGGGIYNSQGGMLRVVISTLSGNTATYTGSGGDDAFSSGNGGGIYSKDTLTVINSTISANSAAHPGSTGGTDASGTGGGIFMFNGGGSLYISESIIAGNMAQLDRDLQGPVIGMFNLIGDGTGQFTGLENGVFSGLTNGVNGNQVGTLATPIDAKLGPLTYNGGPTQTMVPRSGSPAIDAGANAIVPTEFTTDQRGTGFGRVAGTNIDIGATEVHPPTDVLLSSTSVAENQPSDTTVGTLSTVGSDAGDVFTYSLDLQGEGGTDNFKFTIQGNTLQTKSSFDFETRNSYNIWVRTIDAAGNGFEKAFVITIINKADQVPTIVGITTDTGTNSNDGITNDQSPLIHGTSEPGMRINVYFNLSPVGTPYADEAGSWTYDHTKTYGIFPDGTYSAFAIASAPGENTGPNASAPFLITVDTVAPTVNATATPTLDGFDEVHFTLDRAVAGFALGNLSMAVGGVQFSLTEATLASTDGGINWTLGGLAEKTRQPGTYTVTVTPTGITDIAGNALALPAPFFNFVVAADTRPPTFQLTPTATLTRKGTNAYSFTVVYTDVSRIKTASLGNKNLRITGPRGFAAFANKGAVSSLKGTVSSLDGFIVSVTYKVKAPAGGWAKSSNGTYKITLLSNQVADLLNNRSTGSATVGTFRVAIK